MSISSPAINPYLGRWMLFVDGENIVAGAQSMIDRGLRIPIGEWYRPDCFVWMPSRDATLRPSFPDIHNHIQTRGIRAYYYATAQQNDIAEVRGALWQIGFQPQVFPRKLRKDANDPSGKRVVSKGVDIALTTDVLSNAAAGNFDVAVLVAGDADYVPLLDEVKRMGRRVFVASFDSRLSLELKFASDKYYAPGRDLRKFLAATHR